MISIFGQSTDSVSTQCQLFGSVSGLIRDVSGYWDTSLINCHLHGVDIQSLLVQCNAIFCVLEHKNGAVCSFNIAINMLDLTLCICISDIC